MDRKRNPVVYTSDGGRKYHRTPDCDNLRRGQDIVRDRGGEVSPIRRVALHEAKKMNRKPCRKCKPAR